MESSANARVRYSKDEDNRDAGKYYYKVSVVTGQQDGAGTPDTGVFITLTGSKRQTEKVYLQGFLRVITGRGIRKDTTETLVIESDEDLGAVFVVTLGNDKSWMAPLGAPWYVNKVQVENHQDNAHDVFPCYHWIGDGDHVSFTAHTSTINNIKGNPVLIKQRQLQLHKRRMEYQWQRHSLWGLPSSIDDSTEAIPQDEKFERAKQFHMALTGLTSKVKVTIHTVFRHIVDIQDYKKLSTVIKDPALYLVENDRWKSDVEFGRQLLNGLNPVVIEKCVKLPAKFPVTNDMLEGILCRGLSLEQEIEDGRIYICDLKVMDNLPTREGQHTCAPICLLYINSSNQLVPIAIQLQQNPGKNNPIFLPTDGKIDWLLAKIYYQSAHGQMHQISTHYFSCHSAMEAYAMSTMRNLPDPHPIYKLLKPHFRYTMAINSQARARLINVGGVMDQLLAVRGEELFKRTSSLYSVHWTNIVKSCKDRGVDNADKLPGYYYRDDGIKIWNAIKKFVGAILDIYYETDAEVENDSELQVWAEDIYTNGFPGYFGAEDGHGFPCKINFKEQLADVCTLIMFTGSAQHAAVNFGQYDILSFVPNAPLTLRLPPPSAKNEATHDTLMKTLPSVQDAGLQVSLANLLADFSDDELYLGDYPASFTESDAQRITETFQSELSAINDEILERNKKLDVPYAYLLPTKVPNSITI